MCAIIDRSDPDAMLAELERPMSVADVHTTLDVLAVAGRNIAAWHTVGVASPRPSALQPRILARAACHRLQ